MAQLPPDGTWLIQQIDRHVVLYHRWTEEEIIRFDPSNNDETAQAQKIIHDTNRLSDEEKCFAHFWSGYFHAYFAMANQGATQ